MRAILLPLSIVGAASLLSGSPLAAQYARNLPDISYPDYTDGGPAVSSPSGKSGTASKSKSPPVAAASKRPVHRAAAKGSSAWGRSYANREAGHAATLTLQPTGPGRFTASLWAGSDGCGGDIKNAVATGTSNRLVIVNPEDSACRVTIKKTGPNGRIDLEETQACWAWHGQSCSFSDIPLYPAK